MSWNKTDGLDDFEQFKRKPFAVPDAVPDQAPAPDTVICRRCGEVIPDAGRRQLYCHKCSRIRHFEDQVRRRAALTGKPKLCIKCGEEFLTTGPVQKLCRACRYAHNMGNQNPCARKPDRTAYALSMLRG